MTEESIEAVFDDPEAELDLLLAEVPAGYKIQIKRLEPEWCNGIVGTFDINDGETISPEWITKRFGGRKFQIKILDANSRYKRVRIVSFPDVPKRDGKPLVEGPSGPILASEAIAAIAPQQDNPMIGVLEKILAGQTAQANQMQTMLLGRVQGLETILTQKLTEPAAAAVPALPAPDPQSQLRQTLETVRAIEELKGVMGGGEVIEGDEAANPLYNTIVEKLVEKFTAEPQQQSQQQPQQQRPQKYPPGYVPPPLQQQEPSDLELAEMVKQRLKTIPDEQRELLLSHVLDDDEPETPSIAGQDDLEELESLLTEEDLEALKVDDSAENASATVPPSD